MQLSEQTMQQQFYTKDFYQFIGQAAVRSAKEVVPLILELIPCKSVIDVGCGDGSWLKVFKEYGIEEIIGIDGNYINEDILVIPKEYFIPCDLKSPIEIKKKFDLVVSLEVAEHLPPDCAETFVDSLTSLAPVVLFSAAIPYQGGENHINLQWPTYWINLFKAKKYVVIDCIRKKIWNNSKVAFWYSQNTFLFVEQSYLDSSHSLKNELEDINRPLSPVIHPGAFIDAMMKLNETREMLARATEPEKMSLKKTFFMLIKVALKKLLK
jgi:SAM-dependent methyltransferase